MSFKKQSKSEKLSTKIIRSSIQKGPNDAKKSGIAAPIASRMIKQRFDKPIKAMKVKEVFDTYFKE